MREETRSKYGLGFEPKIEPHIVKGEPLDKDDFVNCDEEWLVDETLRLLGCDNNAEESWALALSVFRSEGDITKITRLLLEHSVLPDEARWTLARLLNGEEWHEFGIALLRRPINKRLTTQGQRNRLQRDRAIAYRVRELHVFQALPLKRTVSRPGRYPSSEEYAFEIAAEEFGVSQALVKQVWDGPLGKACREPAGEEIEVIDGTEF